MTLGAVAETLVGAVVVVVVSVVRIVVLQTQLWLW